MHRPLLIVLEGANDITFLVRLSTRLRTDLPHLPDLQQLQSEGQITLLPIGGGDPATWPNRLQALGCHEFHLYDREQHPETDNRRRAIAAVNARPWLPRLSHQSNAPWRITSILRPLPPVGS